MFKKLKERIESVDESGVPRRPPGLAVRSPPADTTERTFADELVEAKPEIKGDKSLSTELPTPLNIDPNDEGKVEKKPPQEPKHSLENDTMVEEKEEVKIKEELEDENTNENVAQLQAVLTQLIEELASVRAKYDTLSEESKQREEELRSEVIYLEAQLDQKTESCNEMESKFGELKWTVENLTSRLQLYSSHDENETIVKLQNEISELNGSKREQNVEIELLETRIAALSRRRHDEQTTDSKTIHKLQQAMSTLRKDFNEKDEEARKIGEDFRNLQKLLNESNRKREELQNTIEKQAKTIQTLEIDISDLKLAHSCELELNNEQHWKAMKESEEKLRDIQAQLKDKEEQLKRIVTELPDQPIAKAVLDGYSRSKMVTSFSNTISAPGMVLKRDNQPVVINDTIDDEEPAILPIEDDVSMETEYEFSHSSHSLLLQEIKTLRSENEELKEETVNKDQTIRVQQQKISDMRKALSKNLKPAQDPPPPQLPSSLRSNPEPPAAPVTRLAIASEVNFQYLKNVVVRFICSREDEASQLLRAITTLLELSPEEVKYINDYLQYKMSWFGSLPQPPKLSIKNNRS